MLLNNSLGSDRMLVSLGISTPPSTLIKHNLGLDCCGRSCERSLCVSPVGGHRSCPPCPGSQHQAKASCANAPVHSADSGEARLSIMSPHGHQLKDSGTASYLIGPGKEAANSPCRSSALHHQSRPCTSACGGSLSLHHLLLPLLAGIMGPRHTSCHQMEPELLPVCWTAVIDSHSSISHPCNELGDTGATALQTLSYIHHCRRSQDETRDFESGCIQLQIIPCAAWC